MHRSSHDRFSSLHLNRLFRTIRLSLIHARRITATLIVPRPVVTRAVRTALFFIPDRARCGFRCFYQSRIIVADMINKVMRGYDRLVIRRHIAILGAVLRTIVAPVIALITALFVALIGPLVGPLVAALIIPLIPVALLTVTLLVLTVLLAVVLVVGLLILLTAFLFGRHLAVRLSQQTGVMLGMLQEILGRDAVI